MNDHIEGADISAFLDGALSAAERALADVHFSTCGACRREVDSLRHLKRVVSSAARRTLPADLALSLESRFVGHQPRWKIFASPRLWIPVGAVAASALAFSVWARTAAPADELPLEPLLAAHERYSAEALVPQSHLVASSYTDQVTTLYADGSGNGEE
jgi:anti-sigma factor RsiW